MKHWLSRIGSKVKELSQKKYVVTPDWIQNIDNFEVRHETLVQYANPFRYLRHIKKLINTNALFNAFFFFLFSGLLAYGLWGMTSLGRIGYLSIILISIVIVYLGKNEKIRKTAYIRGDFLCHYVRLCKHERLDYAYIKDVEVGWVGPRMGLSFLFVDIPFEPLLYSAYAIVVIYELLISNMVIPDIIGLETTATAGLKFVAVALIAIDKAVTAFQDTVKNNRLWSLLASLSRREESYKEPLLESVIYQADKVMAELTHGTLIFASIDEASQGYESGIRQYDAIASINGITVEQPEFFGPITLRDCIIEWRKGSNLILELYTAESFYKEKCSITIPQKKSPGIEKPG